MEITEPHWAIPSLHATVSDCGRHQACHLDSEFYDRYYRPEPASDTDYMKRGRSRISDL